MISSDPNIMGGVPCITGTRVPVRAVWGFHKDGYSIAWIMEEYPTLTQEQIEAAIEWCRSHSPARPDIPDEDVEAVAQMAYRAYWGNCVSVPPYRFQDWTDVARAALQAALARGWVPPCGSARTE